MSKELIKFINSSPTAFQAVSNIRKILLEKGYQELEENKEFKINKGEKYFITRNGSSVIAFNVGKKLNNPSMHISASHSDCPSFKLKPQPIIKTPYGIRLNIETYGSPLVRPWYDRPLSLAGRVILNTKDGITPVNYIDEEPFCIFASTPPHLDKESDTKKLEPSIDISPIVSLNEKYDFKNYLSKKLKVKDSDILGFDLYLYPLIKGYEWGDNKEFITCHHLDNLECAYTSLMGFIDNFNDENINVYVSFDNEEVGSLTRQGANSDFLELIIRRITEALKIDYNELLASTVCLSCDNAHGIHPNHPEIFDTNNSPKLNQGIVFKYNANQAYTTDALSAALIKKLFDENKVAYQEYANKSGIRGGSTLGNITNAHLSMIMVDIGLAQWAMHSPVETCGSRDVETMIKGIKCFYKSHFECKKNGYDIK